MTADIQRPWFGYYDSPEQTAPAYDPGQSAPCLICGEPWTDDNVRTISIAGVTADRSWFYRVHRACDDAQTPEEAAAREALYVEWMVDGIDTPHDGGRCPHGFATEWNCQFCHPEKWPDHGTQAKYDQGCRCDECEAAGTDG